MKKCDRMSIENAIKILKQEYKRAKTLEWVNDPTAYAVYQVWRKLERLRVEREDSFLKDR